ncbi:hypothetical protein DQ238_11425 [Geodermatophilus sp. TF02-6]|nr:L-rhamnose mutarotase [Geodermatophilus sp. TF02-6]RBY78682.1 hypothetical protein DQ238_11425 [Geodermatophilus sp. TF02-6]
MDAVPGLWRPHCARAAVRQHARLGRSHGAAGAHPPRPAAPLLPPARRRAGALRARQRLPLGEWLRPGEHSPRNALEGTLHGAVVATAYYAHSTRVLAEAAAVLGLHADARRYGELAGNVRRAWRPAFVRPDGRMGTDRQDDYVCALASDLLDLADRPPAAARLVELIEQAGDHLATGFLSPPMLLPVLVDTGHADVAFRLLLQTTVPSWLRQAERGATTVWERHAAIWPNMRLTLRDTGRRKYQLFLRDDGPLVGTVAVEDLAAAQFDKALTASLEDRWSIAGASSATVVPSRSPPVWTAQTTRSRRAHLPAACGDRHVWTSDGSTA